MVSFSIINIVALATFLLEAEADPCRPTTTAVTSLAHTSSSASVDTTAISADATTVTTLAGSTTEGHETTTTTAASGCVETQLFLNPGFDDEAEDIVPWTGGGVLTQSQPESGANALAFVFRYSGGNSIAVKQSLSDLDGDYGFSYNYRAVSVSPGAEYTCEITLEVGGTSLRSDMDYIAGSWKSQSVTWSSGGKIEQEDVMIGVNCAGELDLIQVNIDSLAFTRVCRD
ncbi:hypothetical protein ACHAPU_006982 [Fusarium lateritium]